jgi:hypothetical protein
MLNYGGGHTFVKSTATVESIRCCIVIVWTWTVHYLIVISFQPGNAYLVLISEYLLINILK